MGFINLTTRQSVFQNSLRWIQAIYKLKSEFFSSVNVHSTTNNKTNEYQVGHLWGTDSSMLNIVNEYFKVYENFISESEEKSLLTEIEPIFKRRRYQFDHWDGAIEGYRETEKEVWNEENSKIIQRLCQLSFPSDCGPMKHVHVLDLSKNGYIKPHIDSVK
ncbi:alpha-ketoglutarate-dependent dioxygenase alkB homolog 7, mitochondrial, partial [Caerostris extrusa]